MKSFEDVREFIDGTKVQSQYYVKLNPKDPDDFSYTYPKKKYI